jgi:hypothetical protein
LSAARGGHAPSPSPGAPSGSSSASPASSAMPAVSPQPAADPVLSRSSAVDDCAEDSVASSEHEQEQDQPTPHASHAVSPPHIRTRLQQGIRQPKKYTDGTVRYGLFSSIGEPSTLSKALDDSH